MDGEFWFWVLVVVLPTVYPLAKAITEKTTTKKDDELLELIKEAYLKFVPSSWRSK